jgi:LysM repeat protein
MATISKINSTVQTMFDLTIELYGNTTYVFKLIEDNPTLSINSSVDIGIEIQYDNTFVFDAITAPVIAIESSSVHTIQNNAKKSLFDLALELYGGIEYVFKLLSDNSSITDINSTVEAGVSIVYDDDFLVEVIPDFESEPVSTLKYYTVKSNQTLFDLAILLYGFPYAIFKILEDNPLTIPSLQTDIVEGMIIVYDTAFIFETISEPEITLVSTPKYVTIKENQTLFDMSLQLYGSVENVFKILEDNSDIDNINRVHLVGVSMKYTPQTLAITEFFRNNRINITTGANDGRSFDESFSWSFN